MSTELTAIKQDITTLEVCAIVNSANRRLLGGGGVDGVIHRIAGEELYQECLTLNGCMEGEAKITKGYKLPAKWIIHTVGPIYNNENGREADMLKSCYMMSLYLASDYEVKTIAFPNISTGVYGYPIEEAAKIAVDAVKEFLAEEDHQIEKVYFVSFSDEDLEIYKNLLKLNQ
ncbi:MAG: O-acetyl-ADP-ribose deacetylase [Candidatus Moranbacteria bacterium]|jgi:O-acetyl-ADP-ribose deacetylase (regulator of RNase III)|nr:O-acetyl-ADP-ribose deacetylase [Candidatus Moranbacteria bacterium]